MKILSLFEPVSREFLEFTAKKLGLDLGKYHNYVHPREDYSLQSHKYRIFVVADGVTLEFDKEGNYPKPSGAGEIAKIFCETVIKKAEELYSDFNESSIIEVFRAGNVAAYEYNKSHDRAKDKINYWDFDFFAATAAFALIKDSKLYWFTLCDSGISVFDKSGGNIFTSPDCWKTMKQNLPEDWQTRDGNERKKTIRKVYRNGLNEKGEPIGYGVITGELAAETYLNTAVFDLSKEDLVFIYTDGFEDYLKLPEFRALFYTWSPNLKEEVSEFGLAKIKDNPNEFGHERTLFAIQI